MPRPSENNSIAFALCMLSACGGGEQDLSLGTRAQQLANPPDVSRPEHWRPRRPAATTPAAATVTIACSSEADCPVGAACVAQTCRPCDSHGQCASNTCDRYWSSMGSVGYCHPEETVVYVDNRSYACAQGDGTRQRPVCEIQDSIPYYVGNKLAIRVAAGYYQPLDVGGRTMFVYGEPGQTSMMYLGPEPTRLFRLDNPQARLLLDGFSFQRYAFYSKATLHIRQSSIWNSNSPDSYQQAVYSVNSSEFVSEGNRFIGNKGGVHLTYNTLFRIANTLFVDGRGPAIFAAGQTRGRILFNTILNNIVGPGNLWPMGGIYSLSTSNQIWEQDTILFGNTMDPFEHTQLKFGGPIERTVVGTQDSINRPGTIHINPYFIGHQLPDWAYSNHACCINRGDPYPIASSIYWDVFGVRRREHVSTIGAEDVFVH